MSGSSDDAISQRAEELLAARRETMDREAKRSRVLLYHPNEDVRKALAILLEEGSGLKSIGCSTIEEANDRLAGKPDANGQVHRINLVVSDYSIPLDVMETIRAAASDKRLPVILTTADEHTKHLLRNNRVAAPFISLPVKAPELARQVGIALNDPLSNRLAVLQGLIRLGVFLENKSHLLKTSNVVANQRTVQDDAELTPVKITKGAPVLLIEMHAAVRAETAERLESLGYVVAAPAIKAGETVNVNQLLRDLYGNDNSPKAAVVDLGLLHKRGSRFSSDLHISSELLKNGIPLVLTSSLPSIVHDANSFGFPILARGYGFGVLAAKIEAAIYDRGPLYNSILEGLMRMRQTPELSSSDAFAILRRPAMRPEIS